MSQNPFMFGAPIRDQDDFFGRDLIVSRIVNRLRSLQASSVIGERRMGKTSLLYHLQEGDVIKEYNLDPDKYILVYFSFQSAGHMTPTQFWRRLLRPLSEKIPDGELHDEIERLRQMDSIDPFDIEELFLRLSEDLNIVFLLDEFEEVTQATSLDADFFSFLRALATGRYIGLVFVTSSREKLSELSHAGIVGSPFFNIFETFFLKPFSPDSGRSVLRAQLARGNIKFDEDEEDYLMALSGNHPFFLQMGASYLYDTYAIHGLDDDSLRPARLERVEHEFLLQAGDHLGHYWKQSTDSQKIFLTALSVLRLTLGDDKKPDQASMNSAFREADIAARKLGDRGLVKHDKGIYQMFSPAYERWILRELSSGNSKADFGSWLKQNEAYYGSS